MVMCVLVEGAIYKYGGPFDKPFRTSVYLNTVSLFLGIPLSFTAIVHPIWFMLPMLMSTRIEAYGGKHLPQALRSEKDGFEKSVFLKVFVAEVVT